MHRRLFICSHSRATPLRLGCGTSWGRGSLACLPRGSCRLPAWLAVVRASKQCSSFWNQKLWSGGKVIIPSRWGISRDVCNVRSCSVRCPLLSSASCTSGLLGSSKLEEAGPKVDAEVTFMPCSVYPPHLLAVGVGLWHLSIKVEHLYRLLISRYIYFFQVERNNAFVYCWKSLLELTSQMM